MVQGKREMVLTKVKLKSSWTWVIPPPPNLELTVLAQILALHPGSCRIPHVPLLGDSGPRSAVREAGCFWQGSAAH